MNTICCSVSAHLRIQDSLEGGAANPKPGDADLIFCGLIVKR